MGREGISPPNLSSFDWTQDIENHIIVSHKFPIFCFPTQISIASYTPGLSYRKSRQTNLCNAGI